MSAANKTPFKNTIFKTFFGYARTILKLVILGAIICALIVLAAYGLIAPNESNVLDSASLKRKQIPIGLVLGAGVAPDGRPYKELQARLDSAALALQSGVVSKLILSGDNRFSHYDEPNAMMRYLITEKQIDPSLLQPDFAGRSTYESCERAHKIFKLQRVVLISARSHLPRAIYLCRSFGIESYGLATDVEANNSWRREQLARVKALLNVYIIGEPTVLGEPIPLQ